MDISMCSNKRCKRVDCRRHLKNLNELDKRVKNKLYSCADFEVQNEDECEWFWKMPSKK